MVQQALHFTSWVANATKFLTVFGTTSPNRPMTIRPAFSPPIVTSRKTWKFGTYRTRSNETWWLSKFRDDDNPKHDRDYAGLRGAEFLFVFSNYTVVSPEKSQDKEKFRSARKIPPSGKRPLKVIYWDIYIFFHNTRNGISDAQHSVEHAPGPF